MKNPFADLLGAKVMEVSSGAARVQAEIKEEHLNGRGFAHGGFINGLADIAFEYASNSHGMIAIAISTNIQFIRPCSAGGMLEATATLVHLGKTIGSYQIKVFDGDRLVASFTGTVAHKVQR